MLYCLFGDINIVIIIELSNSLAFFITLFEYLRNLNYYLKSDYYTTQLANIWNQIKVYRKSLDPRLSEEEHSQIEFLLNTYVTDNYTQKWQDKVNRLISNLTNSHE